MKRLTLWLVLLSLGALAGCTNVTRDIRVETESTPSLDLRDYTTFSWLGSTQMVNDPQGIWEPPDFDADAQVRTVLVRELRRLGMREVAANPQLVVAFAVGVNTELLEIVENPQSKLYTLQNAPRAALVVVFIDPGTRHPVWVGTATGDAQPGRSPTDVRKRIDYAVTRMLRDARP
jgi:hypothetical protein